MLINTFGKKYFGLGAVFFIAIPMSIAGTQPKYTITPLLTGSSQKPNIMSLLVNANVAFEYSVKNNTSKTSPPLFMNTDIPGLTQVTTANGVCANPFTLAPGATCTLSLQMHGNSPGHWSGLNGLTINSGPGTMTARPSTANLLDVTVSTYTDLYISYLSTAPAADIANYVTTNSLGGNIVWELRGDSPYTSSTSLLSSMANVYNSASYFVMAYWSDWNVYSNGSGRAIPEPSYAVPASYDNNGVLTSNSDFTAKLQGINAIAYSFLEAQAVNFTYTDSATGNTYTIPNQTPAQIGTLYFNDPWADLLLPSSTTTQQNALCGAYTNPVTNPICSYSLQNRTTSIPLTLGAVMGNFPALTKLTTNTSSTLGPLKTLFSVGGYGHDDSFEDMFNSCPSGSDCISNFVTSAGRLFTAYGGSGNLSTYGTHLDGIDLDYENPDMSHDDSTSYVNLITQLRNHLPSGTIISVTVLADPEYLAGTRVCSPGTPNAGQAVCGFGPGTLQTIAGVADHINLMTYDFYGAFSYPGNTAFLTNLNDYTYGSATTPFSIISSVNAAHTTAGVPLAKLSVGIPTYGRALAGISSTNGGLLQPILSSATIPRGDLDTLTCNESVASAGKTLGSNRTDSNLNASTVSCTGSFQYWYILQNMLSSSTVSPGLTEADYTTGTPPVAGTTAYGVSWSPAAAATLTIVNGGPVGSGDLAFNVTIGTTAPALFVVPNYMAPGDSFTYQSSVYNAGSNNISSGGLSINWMTNFAVGPQVSGSCTGTTLPPLTQDTTVTITVNNQGQQTCAVAP